MKEKTPDTSNSIEMLVEGMTCAACVRTIERIASKIEGLENVSVNLATEKISFSSQRPASVVIPLLQKSVEKVGYRLVSLESVSHEDKKKAFKQERRNLLAAGIWTLLLVVLSMGTMVLHLVGIEIPEAMDPHAYPVVYSLLLFFFTIPVLYIGRSFYTHGFKSLFAWVPNMDSLVAISTSVAFLYSFYGTLRIVSGDLQYLDQLYYESVAVILTLVKLGKYLEVRSKAKTSQAMEKLMMLQAKEALVERDGAEIWVPVDELRVGDVLVVKPGARVPVDGAIIEGEAHLDESMITGESLPVVKREGQTVISGSVNGTGYFKYRATRVGADTTLSQIIRLMEKAQSSKAPIARIADVVSGWFVPIVMGISLVAFSVWYWGMGESFYFSMRIFITILVIACPCALGLATPTAIITGTGTAARMGILIKNGEALERICKATVILFDKTGTITEGKPSLTVLYPTPQIGEDTLLSLAVSLEKASEHPLGKALVEAAQKRQLSPPPCTEFRSHTGKGLSGRVDGEMIFVGNRSFIEEQGIELSSLKEAWEDVSSRGGIPIAVASKERGLLGILGVSDQIKADSKTAVEYFKRRGIRSVMVTGDNQKTAQAIANEVGITDVFAEVMPSGKANCVEQFQKHKHVVAMVGDGINDAPALAQADVGIAMGNGTDVAIESADVVLMRGSLLDVAGAVEMSRRTLRNIKQNLFWAFFYNVLGIPLAAGVLYPFNGFLLNPMVGAAAMALSSVSVVGNALRLRKTPRFTLL